MRTGMGYTWILSHRLWLYSNIAKDLEMNRPGMKGFRSPATKKAAREAAKEQVGQIHLFHPN